LSWKHDRAMGRFEALPWGLRPLAWMSWVWITGAWALGGCSAPDDQARHPGMPRETMVKRSDVAPPFVHKPRALHRATSQRTGRSLASSAPKRFKENFSLFRRGKQVGTAFLGLTAGRRGWAFSYRSRSKDALGPIYQRDALHLDSQFRLLYALLSRTRQVAPRLPLVRLWRFRSTSNRPVSDPAQARLGERTWDLDHWAFGYHWVERRTMAADGIPLGRLWLLGAGLIARRYDWAKGGTQVFSGVDFEKKTSLALEVTGRAKGQWLTLTVRRRGGSATIDYDPRRGGPVRVTSFDGAVYEAGAKPFSVPYVQVPAHALDVAPFVWPQQVAQGVVKLTSWDGTRLEGSLAKPAGKSKALAILVPAMGRLDRDGTLGLRRPYAELAARLGKQLGWATLRFDRRGVGRSGGSYASVSLDSEVRDLSAWIAWARRQTFLSRIPLILIAHAEGIYPAITLAARLGRRVRGLVLLEPPGRPYDQVILDRFLREWRFGGLDQKTVDSRRAYLDQSLTAIREGRFEGKLWLAGPTYPVAWLKAVLNFRWRRFARKVRCPVLLMQGGADVFSAIGDSKALVQALGSRRRLSIPRVVPSVGRFFQSSPYALEVAPEEWFVPSPVAPAYSSVLLDWLRRLR